MLPEDLRPEEQDQNEPILRGEYERRHKALQEKYESFAKRSQRILIGIVLVTMLNAGISAFLLGQNNQRTEDITDSQVSNCEKSGNPLRAAVRTFGNTLVTQTRKDIAQGKQFEEAGTYDEIFPGFPKDKLHDLLVEGREDQQEEIQELRKGIRAAHPINCKARFGT